MSNQIAATFLLFVLTALAVTKNEYGMKCMSPKNKNRICTKQNLSLGATSFTFSSFDLTVANPKLSREQIETKNKCI